MNTKILDTLGIIPNETEEKPKRDISTNISDSNENINFDEIYKECLNVAHSIIEDLPNADPRFQTSYYDSAAKMYDIALKASIAKRKYSLDEKKLKPEDTENEEISVPRISREDMMEILKGRSNV